jgi:hypothetical protein
MRKILDITLTPDIVAAIKQAPDGCGVYLRDCTWQFQSVGDIDKTETCYAISDCKSAQLIKMKEDAQAEQTNESAIVESDS